MLCISNIYDSLKTLPKVKFQKDFNFTEIKSLC